jgi:hypothetical protein
VAVAHADHVRRLPGGLVIQQLRPPAKSISRSYGIARIALDNGSERICGDRRTVSPRSSVRRGLPST